MGEAPEGQLGRLAELRSSKVARGERITPGLLHRPFRW